MMAFVGLGGGRLRSERLGSAVAPRRAPRVIRMSVAQDVWHVNRVPTVPAPLRAQGDKTRVAIVGAGLAGLVTAMEVLDSGLDCEVEVYDGRPFVGGKVGSWQDPDGNHIEMGLHVFFGCYYNLFDILKKLGTFDSLLLKEHRHQFVNNGGDVRELDFRMGGVGAPFNGLKAFATTSQIELVDKVRNAAALATSPIVKGLVDFDGAMRDIRALDNVSFTEWFLGQGGSRGSIERMWNPVAYALGFIDCDNISARCMLTIFQLFAVRSEASVLRLLEGSPDRFLTGPMVKFIESKGGRVNLRRFVRQLDYAEDGQGGYKVTGLQVANGDATESVEADIVVGACDVPGAQRLIPEEFRKYRQFDDIFKLTTVPVITVQLRFNGWVTELRDETLMRDVQSGGRFGIDNLLYSADTDFSCFADLALTSPSDYYKEGEGSLLQCVITPADPYMPLSNDKIAEKTLAQVRRLFPSSTSLECTWNSVVKLGKSLYREEPGTDVLRPKQETPVEGMFLAGSYTQQDYIDSMEGACKSGRLAATAIVSKLVERMEVTAL